MAEEVKQEEKAPEAAPKATGSASSGLDANVAALLAYLFDILGGLIFFLIEKENKFVRFAAMQSIVLGVVNLVLLWVVLPLISTLTLGFGVLLYPLYWIAYLVLRIMLMVKAYNNEEWELPVIGKMARNIVK